MKLTNLLVILILVAVVIVSGCSSQKPVSSPGGIVIKDFTIEPVSVDKNDEVTFQLDVENAGTTTATCVRADLLGVDGWRAGSKVLTANIEGFYGEWDIEEGSWKIFKNFKIDPCKIPFLNQVPGVCSLAPVIVNMDCDSQHQGSTCNLDVLWGDYEDKIACNMDTMHPQLSKWGEDTIAPRIRATETKAEQPGGFKTAQWKFKPPQGLPEGTRTPFDITTRVTYVYKTTGTINIPVYSEDEYDRRYSHGISITQPVIEDHSDSPVIMKMSLGTSPIVVPVSEWRDGGDSVYHVPYRFMIQNIGSGFPITGNENGLMVGEVSVVGTGVHFEDCLGISGPAGNHILIDGTKADLIKLNIERGTSEFECGLIIDVPAWDSLPQGTVTITYDLRYEYYTTKTQRITVQGR